MTKRPRMIRLPSGTFTMGSDRHYPEERPAQSVKVGGFRIDVTPVTNDEFGAFVSETGYVALAERPANAADYPGAGLEALAPASAVFVLPLRSTDRNSPYSWWSYVEGADWRHPGLRGTRVDAPLRFAFHIQNCVGTQNEVSFAAQWLAYALPCQRFAETLTGNCA